MSKITGKDTDYGSDFEKKKRKKGKGKKGKQPVKQVVDNKPLPSGHSIQDFWEFVSKCRPQSFRYKLLGPTAPLLSLNPNIARPSSLAPGNDFTTIEQETPLLDEMVEPDSHSLDNEPVDIDVPESASMMVDTLPFGEASPATAGHMTPEPHSTSEDIPSSGESTP
ncbi:hypothetical protein P691DRAFT_766267 [Macrolepiota fuliginosa MF-IS2]|uniref:Uncharacterized protein n=1 Tax=Macrolepiota fuliginosa MF-IS2 TaxID=1400762 RepID=A0A9P5X0Z5_9AGAR|nr:hypothetical protein P691DRAFT_766267 [Macrolepiota fuliginosa MF-IS2]